MPAPFILYACAAALSASGILVGTNVFVVPPGHVGVRRMLGKVDPQPVPPGAHLKSPLAAVHFESTRTRSVELNRIEVLTNEGLSVAFQFNVLYHVTAGGAVDLFNSAGPSWEATLLSPQIRSTIRDVVARVSAKELYDSSGRTEIATELLHRLNDALSPRGVVVEAVPLRTITLPQRLVQAIEDKMRQEQEHERMQFVLMKERAEAERKEIEAAGIAQFQKVVSEGISKELLQWKGIEATQAIAEGTNSKVVVIGTGGSDGLPVILGGLDSG